MTNRKFAQRTRPVLDPRAVQAFMAGAETHSTDFALPPEVASAVALVTAPEIAPEVAPEVTPEVVAAPAPDVAAEVAPAPVQEVAPVAAPVAAKPEKADNRRYGPNGEALHQFTVRLSDADWLKLRMYCIQNRVTATDVIIETVRKLP